MGMLTYKLALIIIVAHKIV